MSESLHILLSGNEFEATPDNTTLFTFLGRAAINGIDFDLSRANHVFFHTGGTDEQTMTGSYMFRTDSNADSFDTITSHMAEHSYPMVLNRRELPECDYNAYMNMLERTAATEAVGDFVPDGWLDEA